MGVHRQYSGLSCQETYFEWQPVHKSVIRVRWIDNPYSDEEGELEDTDELPPAEDIGADGWGLVRYGILEGTTPYGGRSRHLRTTFGPVLALNELWYAGSVPDRPVSRWEPPTSLAAPQSDRGKRLVMGQLLGLIFGAVCVLLWLLASWPR